MNSLEPMKLQAGLVSVCSPCYNVAPYIPRFLDSLLAQTYKNLEIILVNDGATDDTGAVIESYIPRLEAEGYCVIYIEQENGGQASAINRALKHVHGEFMTWPDPDDWIAAEAIEKCVNFLREHADAAMVRGNVERIRGRDGKSDGTFTPVSDGAYAIENFALKLIMCETWFAPLSSMMRMSCFLEQCPGREIYVSRRGGQNLQLLLPLALHYPCWQMQEVLGYYLVRENSHSHDLDSMQKRREYIDLTQDVVLNTLRRCMPAAQAAEWEQRVRRKDDFELLKIAVRGGDKKTARRLYPTLKGFPMKRGLRFKLFLRTYIFPW